ncbi:MAG: DNA-processing protein DprA [Candidatus Binatia bacterium]
MIQPSLSFAEGLSSTATPGEHARWLALTRVKGLGCVSFKKLVAHFGDPTRALAAAPSELAAIEGLQRDAIDGMLGFTQWAEVDSDLKRIRSAGITLVCYTDADYPARLRTIADPPPLLYVKGALTDADAKAVAIVGSRSASDYGRRVARDLARGLASFGFTVVSGMARGIDGMAHETALSCHGRTIAVLGSGVERAYPPEHAKLYQRIAAQGAVISELPMGTKPLAFNFPARNRLISGLSLGVVVVEATEKSGSLITASLAIDQGREVFAVPGEVGSSRSRGAHRLIRQGAKLVETVDDIIEEIAPQLARPTGGAGKTEARQLPQNSSAAVQKVFALLQERSLQIDEIIENSGLVSAQVLGILLDLELQGYLRQLPGKIYTVER